MPDQLALRFERERETTEAKRPPTGVNDGTLAMLW
jgi:hypothetical protein